MLNLIVNRDKIKETYLFANDTEFNIFFHSSDWYRLSKKAIFIVENDTYIVENLEHNHTYPLPRKCIGTDFSVFIIGESANSYKETDKLLVRVIGGSVGNSGGSDITFSVVDGILCATYDDGEEGSEE